MKVTLLLSGKTVKDYLSEGIKIYEQRINRYIPFGIEIVPEIKKRGNLTDQDVKIGEGRHLLKRISTGDFLILLDEKGKEFNSVQFSQFIDNHMVQGRKNIIFAVGGPYGFSGELLKRADLKISLSKMTFSHQIIRIIFLEQLYRAFTIIKGEPYHHG